MSLDNITLDCDEEGIWLIHEAIEGDHRVVMRMGHISWRIIAMYVKGYL